ncbi:ImmA/IrrE family metallo-endopeptidase [Pseudomonas sp. E141]|uniref:ImmA/IrrE family metallo-endopeptidase n=1 Tax=Pseudomonas sp. E141 TaxID=2875961 RepID=UPI0040461CF9
MSGPSYEVPPLSLMNIMSSSSGIRDYFKTPDGSFPIIQILEWVLPEVMPGFEFIQGTKAEMGANHGLTIPSQKQIWLREDVYDRAVDGHGRDRFTAAHELGHLLLHGSVNLTFHRSSQGLPKYRCSEWQADSFAGTLLMPLEEVKKCSSINEIAQLFGVSVKAAETQNSIYSQKGLMRKLP